MENESRLPWNPGSFTKNFRWGPNSDGLLQLYKAIKIGFDGRMEDVLRQDFRGRVEKSGMLDFIPANFFLFNRSRDNGDWIIADELVFQALNFPHSPDFDKLGMFAFNLSMAGQWRGAQSYQRYPSMWSKQYVIEQLSNKTSWPSENINADSIEKFVSSDRRYTGKTTRKLATNLNYLYKSGRLRDFDQKVVERWWGSALFLALDRAIEDQAINGKEVSEGEYVSILAKTRFHLISGVRSLEKDLAAPHLITLYSNCGARKRFNNEFVLERTTELLPETPYLPNSDEPIGAVHNSNPKIIKILPRACALLAVYSGYSTLELDELENFNVAEFVSKQTKKALEKIKELGVKPTMTVSELLKITRGK